MSKSCALVSYVTAVANEAFRCDQLKLCYLWYDEVLFETVGVYDENRFFMHLVKAEPNATKTIKEMTDIIIPLKYRVGGDVVGDILDPHRLGYPRWGDNYENYTYPTPENAEQYAHNCLLQSIETEMGVERFEDGYDVEQAEGRARVAVDAVLLWERVNTEIECMLQAGMDEKIAMQATQQFLSGNDQSPVPFSLFEIAIPSLSKVPWQEIVRLRRTGGLEYLRKKIAEAVEQAPTDLNAAKKLLDTLEKNTIDNILESGRPRITKIAKVSIESIAANFPLPHIVVNPFGIALGIRDTYQAVRKTKDLSWFYMLRDIRSAAEKNVDDASVER